MRVVLLGAGGMLARALIREVPSGCNLSPLTRAELDVRDSEAIARVLREVKPRYVINASAYSNVDGAESNSAEAFAVNADAVGEMARLCAASGCGLVHYSTDYVFDGAAEGFYAESDEPNPLSVYGKSKLAGEQHARSIERHLVIRSQWLFGGAGKSFVSTVRERALAGIPTRAADDQFGCCTYTTDLARTSWELLALNATGVYHVANRGLVSRYSLARQIFDSLGAAQLLSRCSSAEFAGAPRPRSSPLDVTRTEHLLGRSMPTWRDALDRYLGRTADIGSVATDR